MPLPDLHDHAVLTRLLAPLGVELESDPQAIGEDFGFASTLVAVTTSSHGPVVVKAWDPTAHGLGEIEFYAEWAPRLPIRLAACHVSAAGDELALLVLEDLRPVRQGDELARATRAEATAIARSIALVHAATIDVDDPLPPPRFGRRLPPEWHDTRRVAWVDRFGLPEHPLARAVVVHSVVAEEIAVSLWSDAPEGLTHSDLHLDNVVYDGDEPILLDWARPGWGPAVHDLSSVLYSCARVGDFDAVIETHREIVPTDDDQVDGAMLKRLVIATLGTALWWPSTPRQERLVARNLERVVEVAAWLDRRRPRLRSLLTG